MGYSPWGCKESDRTECARVTKGVGQTGLSCPLAPSGSLNPLSLEQFFLSANFRRRCVCVSRGAVLVWVFFLKEENSDLNC